MLSLVFIFIVLIVLGAIAAIVVGIVFMAKSSGQRPGVGGAGCGACGYTTRGVSSFNCPECGADLREVGIVNSGGANRSSAGMFLLFGGIGVMALLGMFMFYMLAAKGTVAVPAVRTMPAPPMIDSQSSPAPVIIEPDPRLESPPPAVIRDSKKSNP